ncbi:MAG: hypothetical protein V7727_22165 [Sneathiella sp.]
MIEKILNYYIEPKILGTLLLATISGAIGFFLGHASALHWLTNHMSSGFGALLSGFVGFTGLIFVAWWSGKQNTQALLKSAEIDRDLDKEKRKQMTAENAQIIIGFLALQHRRLNSLSQYCVELSKRNIPPDIHTYFSERAKRNGIYEVAIYKQETVYFRGISPEKIVDCLNVETQMDIVRQLLDYDLPNTKNRKKTIEEIAEVCLNTTKMIEKTQTSLFAYVSD